MFLQRRPFDSEAFERALADALEGDVFTDQGLNDELYDIFTRIAEAAEPTDALIELARAAFEKAKQESPEDFTD